MTARRYEDYAKGEIIRGAGFTFTQDAVIDSPIKAVGLEARSGPGLDRLPRAEAARGGGGHPARRPEDPPPGGAGLAHRPTGALRGARRIRTITGG
jgi:hypothetical protein